jgi:Zn-dependent peptidase ImmA (M78 family)
VLPLFLDVLRDRGHVSFVLADLDNRCGMVELDKSVIVLDASNTVAEMRSTICHELLHLHCDECPEDEVEEMTAGILVPLQDALAAAAEAGADIAQVAARLGVDEQLVRARLRSIPHQQGYADGVG